ncbi:MAG: hypothetical protein A3D92_17635 [Bacteroidetes bacterium RIFCSPHIGHO2_02_FULL_44_7]|nr:MAG: hypothetical protein A3D92_17635 [Bacteroidetes bacterium RIFCSPHIGHO2_02_FULL_44_7]
MNGNYQLDLSSVTFTHFNSFEDDKVKYSPQFWRPNNTQLDIWEIFPTHLSEDKANLSTFSAANFNNMVVVLYLESYTNDPGACTTISCDNQGAEEVRKLRVLLIHENDMAYLNTNDTLFNSANVLSTYLNVKDADVGRVVIDASNNSDITNMQNAYYGAITSNDTVANLKDGTKLMLEKLGLNTLSSNIQTALTNAFKTSVLQGPLFQYRYDLLKDAVDTYNELKDLFLEEYGICCPNIHAFPKHLLLGKVNGVSLTPENNLNRHRFYKSPILDANYSERDRFSYLANRLLYQIQNYMEANAPTDVIITPSNLYTPLGKRAIPFYYLDNVNLLKHWDYDRRLYGKYERILGYRRSLSSALLPVQKPFKFSIDQNNFNRIEGIQGMAYKTALEAIFEARDLYSLPFDVKVLAIKANPNETIDLADYACEFEDLSVLMKAWTAEQECVLGEVTYLLSGFSTKTEGDNIRKDTVLQFKEYRSKSTPAGGTNVLLQDNQDTQFLSRKTAKTEAAKTAGNTVESNALTKDVAGTTPGDSLVLDNMAIEEDTLGLLMYEAIQAAPGKDSSILIAYVEQALEAIDFELWTPVVVTSTINLPAKILAACYAIEALLPSSIEGLSSTTLSSYTTEIDKLCSYTKKLQAKYKEYVYGEYTAEVKGTTIIDQKILGMMDLLSNQLTNICCGAKKIQILLKEIEDRKQRILDRLLFSVFAEEHPGLEHKAGVEPGGTFVMVYSMGLDPAGKIAQGTVIADFALPYLCCSDCAPINFIIPKTPVSLSLSSDFYCLSDTDNPLTFNVVPADGVIAPETPIPGLTIAGTVLNIDSALFPEEQIGLPIKFTVNAQYTDAVLIVRKKPEVDIKITPNPIAPFTFNFEPLGEISGASFEWDFGDGSPKATTAFATHTYSIPLASGESSVTVTLTVSPGSGTCPASVQAPILFDEVTVAISPTAVCPDAEPIPFTILPVGANPVITGVGVTADMKYFDPSLTAGETEPFDLTYNGNVFASMTFLSMPDPEFIVTMGTTEFLFSANFENVTKFRWEARNPSGDVIFTSQDKNPSIPYETLKGMKTITVVLQVANDCGSDSSEQTLLVPSEPRLSIEPSEFCSNDKGPYQFIVEGFSSPPKITGDGVVNGEFVPSSANIGSNSIKADEVEMLTIQVIQAPTGDFSIKSGTSTLTLDADFTNVEKYKWAFLNTGGQPIRPEIVDNENPTIPYTDFGENQTVIIQLTQISLLCAEASSSKTFAVPTSPNTPAVKGSVSLEKLEYCVGDPALYKFIITDVEGTPTIEGPGVDKAGTSFSPAVAGIGQHTIIATDANGSVISTIIVTVHPSPTANITGAIEGNILIAEIKEMTGQKTFYWLLTDANGAPIRIDNNPSIQLSIDGLEINRDRDPNYVRVTLIMEGDPCDGFEQLELDITGGGGIKVDIPNIGVTPGGTVGFVGGNFTTLG